jgi:hypothetical protein
MFLNMFQWVLDNPSTFANIAVCCLCYPHRFAHNANVLARANVGGDARKGRGQVWAVLKVHIVDGERSGTWPVVVQEGAGNAMGEMCVSA